MANPLFVIGVGASAGGLEALSGLFANLPGPLKSVACFVVAQHLSPHYRSMLVQILAKESVFPVVEARHQQPLLPGQVYITPPDFDIEVVGGLLSLSKPRNAQGPKPSVDRLLASLASEYGQYSGAIILSGTGSDGAAGLSEVKHKGGLAMIQHPDTAKYDGMPLTSLQTGLVDHSLPPEQIGARLAELLLGTPPSQTPPEPTHPDLQRLFVLLFNRFGTNFNNYKPNTLLRRIEKCAQNLNFGDLGQYVAYLEQHPAELQDLYQSFLINVTSFFRDAEAFKKLEDILDKRISRLGGATHFRVWVPGCASGEEAYGLAMLVQHLLDQHQKPECQLQVFATDIDDEALATARRGVYTPEQVRDIPEPLQARFLVRANHGYEVDKSLRSKILFSKHDLTQNPPFLKIDLLSCRNLLIYFTHEVQRQTFPMFHYSLREEGLLFLGKSESISQSEDLFDVVEARAKVFRKRKFATASPLAKFGGFRPSGLVGSPTKRREIPAGQPYRARLVETLVELAQHAYLVLNPALDIIETRGDLSDFVHIPEGALNLNINRLLRKEILLEVKSVVGQAIKEKTNVHSPLRPVVVNQKRMYLNIHCGSLGRAGEADELYLLVIERHPMTDEVTQPAGQPLAAGDHPRIQELETELNMAKQHLQTYIEQIETANEELQSLNEELQSSNEELQSANEELETGNEELQSSNEELQTAYAEIKHFNHELAQQEEALRDTNQVLRALFENTQQGSLLVGHDLSVRVANGVANALFRQIGLNNPTSGQNLLGLLPSEVLGEILHLVKQAQQTGQPAKGMVEVPYHHQKFYYEFCFTPINHSPGLPNSPLAVGILDFTALKRREAELFRRDEMLSSLAESNTNYLFRTDMRGYYTYVNEAFCQKFGFSKDQLLGKFYAPTVHPDDLAKCEQAVEQLLRAPERVVTFEIRKPNPKGGFFETEWEFVTIRTPQGEPVEVQGVGRDITANKQLLSTLERERNQLELMIWGGRLGTWDWHVPTGKIKFNDRWAEILEFEAQDLAGIDFPAWEQLVHPNDRPKVLRALQDNLAGLTDHYEVEHRKITKKGQWKWLVATGKVIERDHLGRAVRVMGIHQDVTNLKTAEEAFKVSENRHSVMLDAMSEGIVIQDLNGHIITSNHHAQHILGLNHQDLLGKTSSEEYWDAVRENGDPFPGNEHPSMVTLRTGQAQKNVVMGLQTPLGTITWISINSQLLSHPDTGVPYAVLSMFYNITERKKIEDKLRKTSELFRQTSEVARVGGWEIDLATNTIYWTDVTRQIHEVEPSYEPRLETAINFYKEGTSRERIAQVVTDCIAHGTPWNTTFQLVTAKGREIWVKAIGQAELVNGKVARIFGTFQDIDQNVRTKQLVMEQNEALATSEADLRANLLELAHSRDQLAASQIRLQAILDSTADANVLISPQFRIISFNKIAQKYTRRFFGKSMAEGQEVWDILPPNEHEGFRKNFLKALRGERVMVEQEMFLGQPRGIWFEIKYFPAYDQQQQLIGASFNCTDIDTRKRAEEKISAQYAALRDIAFTQSHILRRPVASIIGLLALIRLEQAKLPHSPELNEYLDHLATAMHETDAVIRDIVARSSELGE
jgi:two-component system, chemotaxis family, CheB/CheR fusion protein